MAQCERKKCGEYNMLRCARAAGHDGDCSFVVDHENDYPMLLTAERMIVCPVCGDKRCVHAKYHEAPCAKANIYEHNAWVERNMTPNDGAKRHERA